MRRHSIALLFVLVAASCGKVNGLADAGNGSGTGTDASTGPDANPRGTFTVNVPTYVGATTYYAYGPCGGGSSATTAVPLTMYAYCKTDKMNLSVIAYDANGYLSYIEKNGVTFSDGGSTTIGGSWTTEM